ncbi:DUF3995 domain-containing protein [Bosea sp. 685]|uniref:DUF3995 domain-containing protein n=1 Tax=Bosea sp. 685 TaxID=3080057 RepID=UPI002892C349|nr:DUF3995 domain-containing protein [Bosea sp. 685]WNJ88897.1 DUF3995 domain-containing protein [Bosea sp. 685]
MIMAVATVLALVLAAIAGLHVYWGLGGRWPASTQQGLVSTVVGDARLKRMPPPLLCIAVAAAIAVTALWPLLLAGSFAGVAPRRLILGAGVAIMAVFLLRGVAGYVPAWQRKHVLEPFATLDRCCYAPLCLAIAAGYAVLLFEGL